MRFLLRARDTINRYSVCFNLRYVKIYKISTGKKWMAIDSVALNFFVSHLVLIFVLFATATTSISTGPSVF